MSKKPTETDKTAANAGANEATTVALVNPGTKVKHPSPSEPKLDAELEKAGLTAAAAGCSEGQKIRLLAAVPKTTKTPAAGKTS